MDLRNCNWVGSEITNIKIHKIIYESRKFDIGKYGDKKFDVYIRKFDIGKYGNNIFDVYIRQTKVESNIYRRYVN
jgi:hypothetical protein